MNNLKNANTVTLSNNLRLPRTPWGGVGGPLTLPAFIGIVNTAESVVKSVQSALRFTVPVQLSAFHYLTAS